MSDDATDENAEDLVADPVTDQRPVYAADIPVTALLKLAVVVIATVLAVSALARAQQLVGVVVAAGVLAALLAPAIGTSSRLVGRIVATVVIHLLLLLLIVAATAVTVQSIRTESAALEEYTEAQLENLEDDGAPTFLTRTRLDEEIGDAVSQWGLAAVVGEDDAGGIASRVTELVLLIVFSAFFSLRGDELLSLGLRATDDRDRRRVLREIALEAVERAGVFTRRTMAVGLVSGIGAGAIAFAFDLPGALLIGTAAGLLSAVPLLGSVVGWSTLPIVAAFTRSIGEVVLLAAVALAGAVVTNVLRMRRGSPEFVPGPFIVAVGIATGLSAGGLPGAVVGLFLAVGAASALAHDWSVERIADVSTTGASPRPPAPVRTAADDGEPSEAPDNRLYMTFTRSTLLRVTAIVIIAFSLQLSITRIGPTLIWAVIGMLIAVGLDRPVSWLEHRFGVRRIVSVSVGGLVLAAVVAVVIVVASGSFGETGRIDTDVSGIVATLEDLPLVGERLAELDLEETVDDWQRSIPSLMSRSSLADRALSLLGGGVLGAFWILVVAMTALVDGPRLVGAIDRRIPARFRRQSSRLARVGKTALSGYVAGSALVASLNGLIVGILALIVGAPAPVVFAIWAFSWNFVPQIGAIVGWVPFLLVALLVGPLQGLACIGFFVVYQVVENNLIQPAIVGRAVDISPLAALTAALLGATVAGLFGAVLAIPVAGVVRALYGEWRRDDFPHVATAPGTTTAPPVTEA